MRRRLCAAGDYLCYMSAIAKPPTTLTALEFEQDPARATRAAAEGPVVVTDGGRPAHVLMSYEAYEALVPPEPAKGRTVFDVINEPGMQEIFAAAASVDFELPPRTEVIREIDFD